MKASIQSFPAEPSSVTCFGQFIKLCNKLSICISLFTNSIRESFLEIISTSFIQFFCPGSSPLSPHISGATEKQYSWLKIKTSIFSITFGSYLRAILHTRTGRWIYHEQSHGLTMCSKGCMDSKQTKRAEVICYRLWVIICVPAVCMPHVSTDMSWVPVGVNNVILIDFKVSDRKREKAKPKGGKKNQFLIKKKKCKIYDCKIQHHCVCVPIWVTVLQDVFFLIQIKLNTI